MIDNEKIRSLIKKLFKSYVFWFTPGIYWDFDNDSEFRMIGYLKQVNPTGKTTQIITDRGQIYTVYKSINNACIGDQVFIGRGHIGINCRRYMLY